MLRSNGTLSVDKADLRIAANSFTKTYGAPDPLLTYALNGADLKYGESASVVTGLALAAPTGQQASAGTHTITLSGGSAANYNLLRSNGTLSVDKALLSVTAKDVSKAYGSTDPLLAFSATGYRYGESDNEVLTGLLDRASGENPGRYAIRQGSLRPSNNYTLSYQPGLHHQASERTWQSSETPKKYFQKAISYKKHEYKNSIDSKAKSALARLKK